MKRVAEFTSEPKGYRDVYWCTFNGEPFILTYQSDGGEWLPFCDGCMHTVEIPEDPDHSFLGHLNVMVR